MAFNQIVLSALSDYLQRQDELTRSFDELNGKVEQTMRRGLHQAEREIGDHVAALRSDLTRLQLRFEDGEQGAATRRPDGAGQLD